MNHSAASHQPTMTPTPYPLHVEILLSPPAVNPIIPETAELRLLHTTIAAMLQSNATVTTTEIPIPASLNSFTLPSIPHPLRITRITTTLSEDDCHITEPRWRVQPITHLYTHNVGTGIPPDGACITGIPSMDYESLWENLRFSTPIKSLILSYCVTRASYDVSSSGFILLHGPPGSGKSTLAKGLAQKLGVRRGQGCVIRLLHGALSKYFGESAQRIGGVFEYALEMEGVVVIVIDEIETFGMIRGEIGLSGDGIRVTNALLTGLDSIRDARNVVVVGTSNHISGIDNAVLDRADLVLRIDGMDAQGRDAVLSRVLKKLVKDGVLKEFGDTKEICKLLNDVSARRVEGCVVVALGLVKKGVDGIEWGPFEIALRKAAEIVGTGGFESVKT